jgi:diadenosine tetraphosphatase ApaH/serine/threonine PP2A family protein phosphatase
MRYAIFSDVHSNLEAFQAVLGCLAGADIGRYFFAGDIVGYGADPSACIRLLISLAAVAVCGNHDWAVSGDLATDDFNDAAAAAVAWTKERLSPPEKMFLHGLPLVQEESDFCLVHGTLDHPESFDYMTDRHRAAKTFYALKKDICFVGHLHQPGIFAETPDGVVDIPASGKRKLERQNRYIINVGSVGQPRDGDPRACFCIFDDADRTLEFRRLDYDVKKAADKITEAGLPQVLARRLYAGR